MRGTLVNRKWVVRPRPVAEPDVRVICFPHIGAGASIYNEWADRLPAGAELCAVRFPGRENRLDEPPIEEMPELLETLGSVLAPVTQGRFVLFGHCSGSLVAFEFARWLRAQGRPQPELLVVSSIEAPAVRSIESPLHLLPREELFEQVASFGGVAPGVLGDPDLMEMFEPVLRADYRLIERAPYAPGLPLDVPIAVAGGMHDHFVTYESMAAWRWETTRPFSLHMYPTSHFVLDEASELVSALLRGAPAAGAGPTG
ncbi:thioesterase II family protein [Kitasatospora sp. NPDC050467]|uniref:thioesterase II family protein n=1 Tax=Kitasatospora sp. NPDC050467 TaxID=3364053 RepID=UPI003799C438